MLRTVVPAQEKAHTRDLQAWAGPHMGRKSPEVKGGSHWPRRRRQVRTGCCRKVCMGVSQGGSELKEIDRNSFLSEVQGEEAWRER